MSADTEVQAAPTGGRSAHAGGRSFFLRYLGRELGRRARQATVIAIGLALGIGLVITVSAAAAGVKKAQTSVLHSLYGVGTDLTVAETPKAGSGTAEPKQGGGGSISIQGGAVWTGWIRRQSHGLHQRQVQLGSNQTLDNLVSSFSNGPISYSRRRSPRSKKLAHVSAVVSGLALNDNRVTVSSTKFSPPTQFSVQGVDLAHEEPGPAELGQAELGPHVPLLRTPTPTSRSSCDSSYAKASNLKVGSDVTVAKHSFKVIGIVSQPEKPSSPPNIYIPLAVAQALGTQGAGRQKPEGVRERDLRHDGQHRRHRHRPEGDQGAACPARP